MASGIKIESGSLLIGNPIIVSVISAVIGGNVVFHKIKMQVSARFAGEEMFEDSVLSASVENGQKMQFDISNALRSLAARYEYLPDASVFHYPKIEYKVSAWDEYMQEGVLYEKVQKVELIGIKNALFGSFTDMERLASPGHLRLTSYTRKPKTGEVCGNNETMVYSYVEGLDIGIDSETVDHPVMKKMELKDKSGSVQVGGRTVYVDDIENRLQFRFVNGLGVIESISTACFIETITTGRFEKSLLLASPSFKSVTGILGIKGNRNMKLKCSTGPVTKEWAAWWHNEFLSGDDFRSVIHESCWVNLSGNWIPCVCSLDEEVIVYDKSSDKLIQIEFTVNFGISGMISI